MPCGDPPAAAGADAAAGGGSPESPRPLPPGPRRDAGDAAGEREEEGGEVGDGGGSSGSGAGAGGSGAVDRLLEPAGDEISVRSHFSDSEESDPAEKERRRREPQEDGRYYDDPLWYGKTLVEIRCATAGAKSEGNEASRRGDWKLANRAWKDSLKGAEKLQDAALELTLRLNLALGYTRRGKPAKALEHCDAVFTASLVSVASEEQRAKAHYRRAEAQTLAGDTSKAIASLRSSLEIDPKNVEARRKLSELRHAQVEQRRRERGLFGYPDAEARSSSTSTAAPATSGGSDGAPREERGPSAAGEEGIAKSEEEQRPRGGGLTDRARAARLSRCLAPAATGSSSFNVQCGQPLTVCGPLSTAAASAAAAPAQAGGGEPDG